MCGYNSFSHFFVGYLNLLLLSPFILLISIFFPTINKSEVNILVILIFGVYF